MAIILIKQVIVQTNCPFDKIKGVFNQVYSRREIYILHLKIPQLSPATSL